MEVFDRRIEKISFIKLKIKTLSRKYLKVWSYF